MSKFFGIAAGAAISSFMALALPAQTPPPASAVLADAEARAESSRRAIFMIFDASW